MSTLNMTENILMCFWLASVCLQVFSRATCVTSAGPMFKGDTKPDNSSLQTLYDSFRQTVEEMTTQVIPFLILIPSNVCCR